MALDPYSVAISVRFTRISDGRNPKPRKRHVADLHARLRSYRARVVDPVAMPAAKAGSKTTENIAPTGPPATGVINPRFDKTPPVWIQWRCLHSAAGSGEPTTQFTSVPSPVTYSTSVSPFFIFAVGCCNRFSGHVFVYAVTVTNRRAGTPAEEAERVMDPAAMPAAKAGSKTTENIARCFHASRST